MIQFGTDEIKEIYVGSDKVKKVYYGSDLVWGGMDMKSSYAILTDDTRVDFELENTPITNFATTASTVVINGSTITKTNIKKLVFGDSYKSVTSIGFYFLRNCSALTSLDLSAFSNVTSIDIHFLRRCSSLTQFKIGAINVPPTLASGFLLGTTALTTILVPMQSVQAYKTTAPWSSHASKITGY